MKNLIVYMSHHGTTRKVALKLAQNLGESSSTVIDLGAEEVPNIAAYDTILIGGSIHFGRIQKKIQNFCTLNQSDLLHKQIGLFLCAIENYEMKSEFEHSFPEKLRNHATACGIFGGELVFTKMNLIEKIFTKLVYGIKADKSEINTEAINLFLNKIKT
ncbi:MAG: flavodoxin domain-containing protein [Saprospiraceae bacterium]